MTSAAQASSRKKILVVEDEEDVRTFLSMVLQDAGFLVDCAVNGHEALDKIECSRPDIVLLDLMMPGLDGWGVLERLRLRPDPLRVIVLSAISDRHRVPQRGVAAYVSKPFVASDLVRTCERVSAP